MTCDNFCVCFFCPLPALHDMSCCCDLEQLLRICHFQYDTTALVKTKKVAGADSPHQHHVEALKMCKSLAVRVPANKWGGDSWKVGSARSTQRRHFS